MQAGAHTATGLELSATATLEANAYLASLPDFQQECQRYHGQASVRQGDFFDILNQGGSTAVQYQIGYDYTFLCALQRGMHQLWADSWSATIQPGGELITIMFPVVLPVSEADVGPPFPVTPELYSQLLTPGESG